MRNTLTAICGIATAMALTATVQAIPVSGTITMGGEAVLDNSNLGLAENVESWTFVYVAADSGNFGSILTYTPVNMNPNPLNFAPAPGTALPDLWNVGGFTFDFVSDTVSQSTDFLNVTGFGTISAAGYDTTDFTWAFEAETPTTGGPVQFTFSAVAGQTAGLSPVPDGGLTVAFLGLTLASVEGLRRKFIKAKA
jgi:hypothetical protein